MIARTVTAKTIDDGSQSVAVSGKDLLHRITLSLLDGPTFGLIRVAGRCRDADEFVDVGVLRPGGTSSVDVYGLFTELVFTPEDVDPGKRYSLIVASTETVGFYEIEQLVPAGQEASVVSPFGDGDVWVFLSLPQSAAGRVRVGSGYDTVEGLVWVADVAFRRHGFLRQRGNRISVQNDADEDLVLRAFVLDAAAPLQSLNYVPITSSSYTIELGQLAAGRNIIGIQTAGAVSITIPRSMPEDYLLTIKDEAGGGNVTVTPQ